MKPVPGWCYCGHHGVFHQAGPCSTCAERGCVCERFHDEELEVTWWGRFGILVIAGGYLALGITLMWAALQVVITYGGQ